MPMGNTGCKSVYEANRFASRQVLVTSMQTHASISHNELPVASFPDKVDTCHGAHALASIDVDGGTAGKLPAAPPHPLSMDAQGLPLLGHPGILAFG